MNPTPEVVMVVFVSACMVLMAADGLYILVKHTKYWLQDWLQERSIC